VLGLLVLTIFETPLWCRSTDDSYWDFVRPVDRCAANVRFEATKSEVLVSKLPFLPYGYCLIIEYALLGIILARVLMAAKLQTFFRGVNLTYRSNLAMVIDYAMILLGFCDAFYFSFFPSAKIRVAPFIRFGLAVTVPWVNDVVRSFVQVSKSIVTIGVFLLGTVVIFAWVAAMIFDDLGEKDEYGMNVNQGFENFGNSLYTMFVTMTTAILPDVMIPSYEHNRIFLFFWMPFYLLAVCIFTQVILATVYSQYGDQVTERVKQGHKNRLSGIRLAFDTLRTPDKLTKHGKQEDVVRFDQFVALVQMLRNFSGYSLIDEQYLRVCFEALDDDKSESLNAQEFVDMCAVLQTKFYVTKRDSWVREQLEGSACGGLFERAMSNGAEGPDFGCCPPAWAESKFSGSLFDKMMNVILGMNVVWMVVQSVYDLNDIPEPSWFFTIDMIFSFGYTLEVAMKLCWWSFEEYWVSNDNRFDFVTTMVLAGAGIAVLCFNVSRDFLRLLNLLRLVRLLKALNNIPAYEETVATICRMITTCGDVLVMNMLMIYLWSAWGLQLFGGQLFESNPILKDQDLAYFESHYQVYNFNDMGLAMVSMFFVTITNWNAPLVDATLALYRHFTFDWYMSCAFWLTFYVGSPLIAFNVFTAFSIDVFCKIEEMSDPENFKKSDVERNLEKMQAEMAETGWILHIQESSELQREKIYAAMFAEEDKDGDNANEGSGGDAAGEDAGPGPEQKVQEDGR